jgi:hypothetical protein
MARVHRTRFRGMGRAGNAWRRLIESPLLRAKLPRMKNLKSLQTLALAGVAVAFMSGCSSTQMSQNSSTDQHAGYRFASSGGWVPLTDTRYLGMFPLEWNPVAYENYTFAVPVQGAATTSTSSLPQFSENLQPGEAFVEAAGGASEVKRVIKYSPFQSAGIGR